MTQGRAFAVEEDCRLKQATRNRRFPTEDVMPDDLGDSMPPASARRAIRPDSWTRVSGQLAPNGVVRAMDYGCDFLAGRDLMNLQLFPGTRYLQTDSREATRGDLNAPSVFHFTKIGRVSNAPTKPLASGTAAVSCRFGVGLSGQMTAISLS